ncbi:GCN5-related N-acetyltransferase [Gloeothece citriformis PCC 7424]|uniref:GCN5-related N-acetyltransferase n=1 Tax=Gloeothece citriformis (strain PCC 7424) TaxID=65393 RepID=B7KA61_GLOC7|nr:GNAT family N-acetyltransferase [Gloeothece citriformis]ACK71417.1 GCN5-related N-acetyltransferase [Gloeothece citriformis PCC 7424]
MNIREATEGDLPTIVEIYNASIPSRLATADINPISVESRINWFYDHPPQSRPIWVMEIDNKVVGWLSFQSFLGRPAYHCTAELSLYVSPDYKRLGIGQKLLQQAIDKSPSLGLNTLIGYIFAHNKPSLQLFTKYEFQQWGFLPKVAVLDGIERDLIIVGRRVN